MHVTLAIISKSVLGSDIKSQDEVGSALLTCMEYSNRVRMPFGQLIAKIPILPVNKGYQRAKKKLDLIVYSMIKEHRDKESKGTSNADLLYTLLQAQDAEAGIGRMNDSQLKDEVMTIFVAGHETTANALGHFIYYHSIQLKRLVSMKNYVLYLVRTAAIQEFQLLKIYRNWNILKRSLENP